MFLLSLGVWFEVAERFSLLSLWTDTTVSFSNVCQLLWSARLYAVTATMQDEHEVVCSEVAAFCRLGIVLCSVKTVSICCMWYYVCVDYQWMHLADLRAKLYNKQRFKEKVAMRKR